MIHPMRTPRGAWIWLVMVTCLLSWAALPGNTARAQSELEIETDARLEGYDEKLALEPGNNAMTWMGFGFLAVVTLLGLFKDAKRSHLD
jgi:hypothetical protein